MRAVRDIRVLYVNAVAIAQLYILFGDNFYEACRVCAVTLAGTTLADPTIYFRLSR